MKLKAYWGTEENNFGDLLNKTILDYCRVSYEHTTNYKEANFFCIGSVIRLAKNSIVLGSGIIKSGIPEELDPNNRYEFVRGPRTRERVLACGGECPPIYGDPALLVPRICPPAPKGYRVGFVPHYTHKNHYTRAIAEERRWEFIDVNNKDPLEVAQKISQCEKIVSTSLHGIIVAHAYGIPAAHIDIQYPDKRELYGQNTKFIDYYESVDLEHRIGNANKLDYQLGTLPDLNKIESLIKEYEPHPIHGLTPHQRPEK